MRVQQGSLHKLGVLCLVLTLCLAAIGVGYGNWSENLDIQGTLETGEVDVEFVDSSIVVTDNEDPWVPAQPDVGLTTVSLADSDEDGDYDEMTVQIESGYYCYRSNVSFDVRNNGSVPVRVVRVEVTEPLQEDGVTPNVDVTLSDPNVGDYIDPGQTVNCVLSLHVNTNVKGTYQFDVEIEVYNWNEGGA